MFNLRLINEARIQKPCDPPVTYIQDDMAVHDLDRAMVNVSIELAQDILVDRLIENVRVSMKKRDMQKFQMKGTTW